MTKRKRRKPQPNHKRKSLFRPPYFINKNQQFEVVRKRMTMKTDGPTLNEMSNLDTTGNVGREETPRAATTRPVSTSNQLKNFLEESWKQIIIGLVSAVLLFILGRLIIHHDNHLIEHDKDIEFIQKNDVKQDADIDQLKDKTNNLNTDMRLLEQRMDIESEKSSTTKKKIK